MLEIREKLSAVEDRLRSLREERARAAEVKRIAVAAAKDGDDASYVAAEAAHKALLSVEAKIGEASDEQVGLLRKIGDAEAGRAGFAWAGISGWDEAAKRLSLARGDLRVDVAAASLLQSPPLAPPLPTSPTTATAPAPASNRWLFPVFASAPFGAGIGDLAATDFTVSFEESALTGVEREPDAMTDKATLSPTVALATPTARQFAVVLDPVPVKVFDSQDALRALLSVEMSRQLSDAYDIHCVSAIESASPPNGSSGSDLVAKIRNAIADMRDLGGEPTVIALTPSDAASLDLSVQPGTGDYVFRVDLESSGSPVWSLRVREVPSVSDPLLVDPVRLGLSYLGDATVLVDPYTGLKQNTARARVEAEARFHVRDARGAFAVA